jgi:hypothetical protein
MPAKRIVRRKPQQDFATRFAAARTDKQWTALIKAAKPEEIKAVIAAMPPEDWALLITKGDPERLALLKSKGIKFHLTVNANKVVPIRGGDTKHGTGRRWGKRQFIQEAFIDENVLGHPLPPKEKVNLGQLTERVNDALKKRPDYQLIGPVTRWAVKDAFEQARAACAGKPTPKRKK